MYSESFENKKESVKDIQIEVPAVETLLDPAKAIETWPESITTNEAFLEQTAERRELKEILDDVFKCLPQPDMSFEDAVSQRFITEEQVKKVYSSLSRLFDSGQGYERMALYLPFELLPGKDWNPATEELQQASSRFKNSYMDAWKTLLSQHDVRANFVDGDVLEPEHRKSDLPRVVKAAHLIPKLVEKGFIRVEDVIVLMEESKDQVLKESIADALAVLADLGLITEKEFKNMSESKDRLVRGMAKIISSDIQKEDHQTETTPKSVTFSNVQGILHERLSDTETDDYKNATEKRKQWLKQKIKQEIIESLGDEISLAIVNGNFSTVEEESFLSQTADPASQQALVEGIRKAVETGGPKFYTQYKKALLTILQSGNYENQEAVSKTLRRLNQLGIVKKSELAELNIVVPELAGTFSKNLELIKEKTRDIQKVITDIESNPELSRLIYPVALLFGSHIKGYGEPNADIDLAVFIKPETPFDNREKIQSLLRQAIGNEKLGKEIVEFWLETKDDKLNVRDFPKSDPKLGESFWTHVLFGAVWEGNKDVMRELKEKLLVPYMHDSDKKINGQDARALFLGEIERDALQYRLMHKGYARFFPSYGGIITPHSDSIDSNSMFWDSGYRQLATRLFANRVFIPKIPSSKK